MLQPSCICQNINEGKTPIDNLAKNKHRHPTTELPGIQTSSRQKHPTTKRSKQFTKRPVTFQSTGFASGLTKHGTWPRSGHLLLKACNAK
jgi:hypothetical protein